MKAKRLAGLCGESVYRTKRLDLVWRVSAAHWYQITERGYFNGHGDSKKESGPLMKEAEAIRIAGRLLSDALGRDGLQEYALREINRMTRDRKFVKSLRNKK